MRFLPSNVFKTRLDCLVNGWKDKSISVELRFRSADWSSWTTYQDRILHLCLQFSHSQFSTTWIDLCYVCANLRKTTSSDLHSCSSWPGRVFWKDRQCLGNRRRRDKQLCKRQQLDSSSLSSSSSSSSRSRLKYL